MIWKEYSLDDGTSMHFCYINNFVLSVQFNAQHKNWHFCCWNRNNENIFLVDTEQNPKLGFLKAIDAILAANSWYSNYINT